MIFPNFKDAKGILEKTPITSVTYAKDNQTGHERTDPIGENIIPKTPKIKIKIVIGAKNGTIKIFTIGEIKGIYPKLQIKIGRVKTWADRVAERVVFKGKNLGLGIFFRKAKNAG